MRISEIFYSLQGEGIYAGQPMVFVRFQGCPFRCEWCDSEHTWDFAGGSEMSLEDVLNVVRQWPAKRVCITGGEPLAHLRDFTALAEALHDGGYWMEVETAGGYRLPMEAPVDCWVVDVKCPDSGMERFNKYQELAGLRPQDQLKFVIASREDFDFALGVLRDYRVCCAVVFSPVWGRVDAADLAEWIKEEAVEARLSLQIHKVIWDPVRRGV